MKRIDHASEARKILNEIPGIVGDATQQAWCTEALVHAQLAVAEQLKIGNMIALSVPQEGLNGAEFSMPSWIHKPTDGYELDSIELRPEIAAALGVSNE